MIYPQECIPSLFPELLPYILLNLNCEVRQLLAQSLLIEHHIFPNLKSAKRTINFNHTTQNL